MTIGNIYSVFDSAKSQYLAPFVATTDEEAKRFIVQQINVDSTSFFALYPQSFSLHYLGTFDHSKGAIKPLQCGKGTFLTKNLGTFEKIKGAFETNGKSKTK